MSSTQRATIAFLIIAALGIWGLGLRAALRPDAQAEQSTATESLAAEGPTQATPTLADSPSSTPTPTPSPRPATATPSQTHTPTSPPTATATRPVTPTPSVTPTDPPTATPAPTGTSAQLPSPSPLPAPGGTPQIPKVGRFLLVDQDQQVMQVYENGVQIRAIPVSTGRPVANAFTPAWRGSVGRYWGSGPFLDYDLWSDHMWYLFPGARGSILIHSVPYTWDGDLKIYDQPDALGVEPASHGCVRISPEDARWLQDWDPVGVSIEITPWTGEIGPPDETL